MKKILKWLIIGGFSLAVVFIAAVLFAISGPRPDVVEGIDRPEWLPEHATSIFHRSQEGFGWWRAAEFTISETDFRGYAAKQGWQLVEVNDLSNSLALQMLRSDVETYSEEDFKPIARALVYDSRASNNGGITVALDLSNNRAYYMESHR